MRERNGILFITVLVVDFWGVIGVFFGYFIDISKIYWSIFLVYQKGGREGRDWRNGSFRISSNIIHIIYLHLFI